MHRTTWRSLLAFALLIAIPFQAIASTGMLACGPDHHRMLNVSPLSDVSAQVPPAVSLSNSDSAAAHNHASAQPQAISDVSSDDAASLGLVEHSSHSKCNSGAPCCTASALISENALVLDGSSLGIDFPAVQPLHWPWRVTTLERPPRG